MKYLKKKNLLTKRRRKNGLIRDKVETENAEKEVIK